MKRREFLKYGTGGLTALVVGSNLSWLLSGCGSGGGNAAGAGPAGGGGVDVTTGVESLNFHITDAVKEMVTHNSVNNATCYFWVYKEDHCRADAPGPVIYTTEGDTVKITVTNDLDSPHSFFVDGAPGADSGPIAPGASVSFQFTAPAGGTYLYYDNVSAPVGRVMGLHGAFIVMPRTAAAGHAFTPYSNPGPNVQKLFDDLGNKNGNSPWWPGLRWEEGDPATDTPPFRQNIWVLHQASPKLFAAVGNNQTISFTTRTGESVTGNARDPVVFTKAFLHDSFNSVHDPNNPDRSNYVAQFFTINGQSGHFAHNSPWICPYSRVGEPYLIRILNAGLWLHSTHIHANHIFVLSHNRSSAVVPGSPDNPIWVDVYTANPLDTYDWLIPYMRPPDVPNDLGIGRDDLETSLDVRSSAIPLPGFGLASDTPPFVKADIPASVAQTTWPPEQEMKMFIPNVGTVKGKAQDGVTLIDCAVRLSPVCFPMHDHSEPSQVAQGGNYNCGLISGIVFTGDRKSGRPGETLKVLTFADRPESGDPEMPVPHGPDIEPGHGGDVEPAPDFKMPSIP